jgi:hypothetical protein
MDWLKGLDFSREYLLPIQHKINLNIYNVSILKKYFSKSFIENPDITGFLNATPGNIDAWNDLACFEGYISASLCFLYFIEDILCKIREGKDTQDSDDYSVSTLFLRLLGTYNKMQEPTACDTVSADIFKDMHIFDHLWDIELKDVDDRTKGKLLDFCPPGQSKLFYLSWNCFCTMVFGRIEIDTGENDGNRLCSPGKIKFPVLDSMDEALDKYLKKYYNETSVFWGMVHLFITCEFGLPGYKNLEVRMDAIDRDLFKNDKLSWKEHARKELDYSKKDEKNIRTVLDHFTDKGRGLTVAINLLFSEKTGAQA